MSSLDVDQKSTCTAPGGGGVKETKQYFEEEGDQIYLGGLGPLFNNGTGDTEDREDDRPSSDSSSGNVSSLVIVKARYRATSHRERKRIIRYYIFEYYCTH